MLAYLERLIVHSFSAIDREIDWRLSFPYQIVFQKVRTKMDLTVRIILFKLILFYSNERKIIYSNTVRLYSP
jgi:hypothetical protein